MACPNWWCIRLLQPVIEEPNLRLLCHEGNLDDLLGDLALHRLDVVLSDRTAPVNPNIKLYSHTLGSSAGRLVRDGGIGESCQQRAFRTAWPRCHC